MNLRVLNPSRKRVRPGDVFALQVVDGEYMFGRVISTEGVVGFMQKCILVYIYGARSNDRGVVPELRKEDLILPPFMTTSMMWTRGYFDTVERRPLLADDVYPVHCFEWSIKRPPEYYDEHGNELETMIEPCGEVFLFLDLGVDRRISNAIGLPSD